MKQKMLSNHEISVFCRQMSMLIKSGIAPAEGIDILLLDTTDKSGPSFWKTSAEFCRPARNFILPSGCLMSFPPMSYI